MMSDAASVEQEKAVRLVEYFTKLASLRTKVVRDADGYRQVLWLHQIPHDKGCFTRAWGADEEYDQDAWLEVQIAHEPELPRVPETCQEWVNQDSIWKTDSLPALVDQIIRQEPNPRFKEGTDLPQFINTTEQLADHPEVARAWERYIDQKWLPWAELHDKWKRVQHVYSILFAIHQEQLRLGEEFELVVGLGLLTWQTPSNQRVRRHLVVANASLEFEARLGKFTVRPHPDGANLRPELDMLDIEEQPARAEDQAREALKAAADDPWEKGCVEGVLQALVHSIKPDGEYHARLETETPPASSKPIAEYAPALILRQRSVRGLTDVLRRIKEAIERGDKIPPEFKDIAEIGQPPDGKKPESEPRPPSDEDPEVYFPKPSNEEQRRIVETLRTATGVLVQGPPGTGKSHTIANLICHLLAKGQRILITAKTPRALQVLQGLVPKELQPLSISLLGSGKEERDSLEASIGKMLRKKDEWDERAAQQHIEKCQQHLRKLREDKAETERRLRAIRESETHSQSLADGAYRGTAAQIARAVQMDKDRYGWFRDTVQFTQGWPFGDDDLCLFLKGLRLLTDEKRRELRSQWPKPDSVVNLDQFAELVTGEGQPTEDEGRTSPATDINAMVTRLLDSQNEAIEPLRACMTEIGAHMRRLKAMPYPWVEDAIRDVCAGTDSVWEQIRKESLRIESQVAPDLASIADKAGVTIPDGQSLMSVRQDARTVREYLGTRGRMRWWPFRPKAVRTALRNLKPIRLNGQPCDTHEVLRLLLGWLRIGIELDRGWNIWSGRAERQQGPYAIQLQSLKSLSDALGDVLSLRDELHAARKQLNDSGIRGDEPSWENEDSLHAWVKACDDALAKARRRRAADDLRRLEQDASAVANGRKPHAVSQDLLLAIRARDTDAYARAFSDIEHLEREKKSADSILTMLDRIREQAPLLAEDLENDPIAPEWDDRMPDLRKAWAWAQARHWLDDYIGKDNADDLAQRVLQIQNEVGKAIAELAALRAWSICLSRMTEEHSRHMVAWQQSMRKVGKGTGKHAARHRRDAQKHLNQCRDAVPAWVMPLHRVWDTVDPSPGMFDVIVVDEASQCGFEAFPLLYLGKKILIVGDDKQISPEAVGILRDAVYRLMEQYLWDFKFKDAFGVEASLFAQGQLRYGTRRIVLREHFRCMPEIIRFSNDLCYSDTPLIPLRQYGPDRLDPLVRVFVERGYREGTHTRVINQPEAEAVVDKIVELCRDERYRDKTMGVVVLQGEAQGKLVEDQLLERLGAEEMVKRRLICGNPYSFQGDERDVIFLSMVAAPNERIGPLTMSAGERRFNVAASRARDQMWLFHSVQSSDLSASCLRRRLLEFFEETKPTTIAGIDCTELEKKALRADRAIVKPPPPFESWFEVDVALEIARRGYKVIPQFEVARKRIDLVVEGGKARLAVECDGGEWHGPDQYEADMARQRVLERCGWVFFRVRESAFYANKTAALEKLWLMLEERGITPQRSEPTPPTEPKPAVSEPPVRQQVEVGDTVAYVDETENGPEMQAQITSDPSNPDWGTINMETPIARALLGAEAGDVVEARLPVGVERLRIVRIRKGRDGQYGG